MIATSSNSNRPAAVTDANGSFRITFWGSESIPVGEYRVVLDDLQVYQQPRSEDRQMASRPPTISRIPPEYRSAAKSPWKCTVRTGNQSLELDLPARSP